MTEDWDLWNMSMAVSTEGDSSVSEREGRLFRGLDSGVNMFSGWCWVRLTGRHKVVLGRAVRC